MSDNRDWQADMELIQKPHKDMGDVVVILDKIAPYWIEAAEKWRFEASRKYPTPEAYDAACAALHEQRERADQAEKLSVEQTKLVLQTEAREQKLKEAIVWTINESGWGDPGNTLEKIHKHLMEELISLYPKEAIGMSQYETDICPECGGSCFSGYGTGYDAVCDSCGGIGEVIVGVKKSAVVVKEPEA